MSSGPIQIVLHVDARNHQEAIEIAEQLSRQATGFALSGMSTMISIDPPMEYDTEDD